MGREKLKKIVSFACRFGVRGHRAFRERPSGLQPRPRLSGKTRRRLGRAEVAGTGPMEGKSAAAIPPRQQGRLSDEGHLLKGGKEAASVGGLCYPPLAAAVLAPDRIDFATGLSRLLDHGKSGAVAFRAFMLSRFLGLPFHLIPLSLGWRALLPL